MRIVLVAVEEQLSEFLRCGLMRNGHQVDRISVPAGVRQLRAFDLVLLDLAQAHTDRLAWCRNIRLRADVPVICFTRGGSERDRVSALSAGADDCVESPFGFRELLARIDAVTRRHASRFHRGQITHPPLRIDLSSRCVSLSGNVIQLTEKEFDLLSFLAARPGRTISREEIMSRVWDDLWNSRSRTIDTHVSSIRGKLGRPAWITTVRGVGFRFIAV